jgi:ABC-type oligopeptide transport system ATPase subunit
MSKRVKILSGASGCGKSTLARELLAAHSPEGEYPYSVICLSADQFFMVGDEYKYEHAKIGEAHAKCFRNFLDAIGGNPHYSTNLVVVDNTNTTVAEIAPYVLAASAFGYEHEIITIVHPNDYKHRDHDRDWIYAQQCAARNVHGVNVHAILAQVKRIEKRELPKHWKHRVALAEDLHPIHNKGQHNE